MSTPLCVEKVPEEKNPIEGFRVVELGYVLDWAIDLNYEHFKVCTGGKMKPISEVRVGLVSTVVFRCDFCMKVQKFSTENPKSSTLNKSFVFGTLSSSGTYTHSTELLSCMDIPSMSENMFYDIEKDMDDGFYSSLLKSMTEAGEKEKAHALELGNVDEDGIPWIGVYLDGSWSKRSYGTGYSSLSGMAAIIGQYTGQVLFIGVRNKYCIICARAQSKDTSPKKHKCFKNWDQSASSMEADIIVEGFNSSVEMHGVRFKEFIADGDSSVFSEITKRVDYGRQVRKWECTNHVLKNYTKHLYKVKSNTSISLAGRKLLTKEKIESLMKRAQQSIYEHAVDQDVNLLRRDLEDGLPHVFGDHLNCREEICKKKNSSDCRNLIPELKASGIYNYIKGALDLVWQKAGLLVKNANNNASERLMNIVARFNQGKRLNLITRGAYTRRVWMAALRYNKGFRWYLEPYERLFGKAVGPYFQKFINKQILGSKKVDVSKSKKKSKRVVVNKPSSNEDPLSYGPLAIQPEDEGVILLGTERLIQGLTVTREERDSKELLTKGQFGNPHYEAERQNRLTASLFGQVVKKRESTHCKTVVKKCLYNETFYSRATEYGKVNESVAIKLFEKKANVTVVPSGLWIDIDNGFLAVSPDGLVGEDSLVEVKCLFSASNLQSTDLKEIVKEKKGNCLEIIDGSIRLKRNHNYYYQIQGQLNVTGRQFCYFVVYVNDNVELFIEKIEKDEDLWESFMLPKLSRFYRECIAREIVTKRIATVGECSICEKKSTKK